MTDLRALALQWLDYACNGTIGRTEKGDPVYDAVTEHRDTGDKYSSCGDLAHWLLYRLGVRATWVNREEHQGWKVGQNISWLAWRCVPARAPLPDEKFHPGDILLVWNKSDGTDAHACVVREHCANTIKTADYGQPGGKFRERVLTHGPSGGLILGSRKIQRVLPLEAVIADAEKRGQLVEAERPAETESETEGLVA